MHYATQEAEALLCCMVQAYQRQLLLEKIMDENDKTAHLLSQRQTIQEQRKAANMAASMHRNKVNQLMESMKNVHNLEKLAPGECCFGWSASEWPCARAGVGYRPLYHLAAV